MFFSIELTFYSPFFLNTLARSISPVSRLALIMCLLLLQFIFTSLAVCESIFDFTPIPKVIPRAFQWQCNVIITHRGLSSIVEEYHEPYTHDAAHFISGWTLGGPRIWNLEPVCMHDPRAGSICVYTSSWFANGRGLSLLSSPSDALLVEEIGIFKTGCTIPDIFGNQPGEQKLAETRFERRTIPGKGFGLVAKRTIQRGEVIYAKTPLTMVSETAMKKLGRRAHRNLLMQISVERLPPASRELFMEMEGHFGGNPYYDRINTNSFTNRVGSAMYWNVYPESARLNHDCRPSTAYNINPNNLVHSMNVLRPIQPGEEITDSYILPYHTSTERHERTSKHWGFNCSCSLCTAPDSAVKHSDDRLRLIRRLEHELGNMSFAGPRNAEKPVSLYQQERLDGAIAEAYSFAALESAYVADKRMTTRYAALAVEALRLWRGEWHEATRSFTEMLTSPETHPAWNYRAVAREVERQQGRQTVLEVEQRMPLQPYGSVYMGFPPIGNG